jgi:hypothetical protein
MKDIIIVYENISFLKMNFFCYLNIHIMKMLKKFSAIEINVIFP